MYLFIFYFFSLPSQSLVSKTIDVASAQFAASALLTSDQLMALKSKEEGVGVNGVVSASGWSFKLYTHLFIMHMHIMVYFSLLNFV